MIENITGKGLNAGISMFSFSIQLRLLTTLNMKPFENIVVKGENAGNQHFLLFPLCFLPILKRISVLKLYLYTEQK